MRGNWYDIWGAPHNLADCKTDEEKQEAFEGLVRERDQARASLSEARRMAHANEVVWSNKFIKIGMHLRALKDRNTALEMENSLLRMGGQACLAALVSVEDEPNVSPRHWAGRLVYEEALRREPSLTPPSVPQTADDQCP